MVTLDQKRAKLAFEQVSKLKEWAEADQNKYASLAYAMPALLRSAGLSQALHFVQSRRKKDKDKSKSNDGPKRFLEHLAAQLTRVDEKIGGDSDKLLEVVRGAELADYLRLTREALACVNWYRRFVQGVLGIEPGEANDTER